MYNFSVKLTKSGMGKYKSGSRRYQDYTLEILQKCLEKVRNKEMSVVEASKTYNIPKRTLFLKLKNPETSMKRCGRPTFFNFAEEEMLKEHLLFLAEFGVPITQDDLKICVIESLESAGHVIPGFNNNCPGRDWVKNFLRRHQILRTRIAENVKLVGAGVTEESLRNYIDNLKQTLEGVPIENIYNFDETNLTDDPGRKKVQYILSTLTPTTLSIYSNYQYEILFLGDSSARC